MCKVQVLDNTELDGNHRLPNCSPCLNKSLSILLPYENGPDRGIRIQHCSYKRASPVSGIGYRSLKERKEGPVDHFIDNEMGDRSFRLEHPVSAGKKSLGRKRRENRREAKLSKDQPKPNLTEPYPGISVNRPLLVAPCTPFKKKKTNRSRDITQSMEPKPNKTPLIHTLEGLQTKSQERTFLSR